MDDARYEVPLVVLSKQGEVPGEEPKAKIVTKLKTREDLGCPLELHEDVNDFESKSKVTEAIAVISDLLQVYWHVSIELKVELDEEEYLENHPDYVGLQQEVK